MIETIIIIIAVILSTAIILYINEQKKESDKMPFKHIKNDKK